MDDLETLERANSLSVSLSLLSGSISRFYGGVHTEVVTVPQFKREQSQQPLL